MSDEFKIHPTEIVDISDLSPHPRNYRKHPADQIQHIEASLSEHGFYRNVVVARDGTILAGHGVVETAELAGATRIPVIRLDLDPDDPKALAVIAGDNELGKLADSDDRLLTELLREVSESDAALLGTGYDEAMLAGLLFVTRTEREIGTMDAAAEWLGMPEFEISPTAIVLMLHFDSEAERDELIETTGVTISKKNRQTWAAWWPPRLRDDAASVMFDA